MSGQSESEGVETLTYVLYYQTGLAAFILNIFQSKDFVMRLL